MVDTSINRLMETRRKAIEKRARAEEERASADSDVSAIDRVLKLLGVSVDELQSGEAEIGEVPKSLPVAREDVSSPSQGVERPVSRNGHPKIRITQEIRSAVQEFDGEFTQQDVLRRIKDKYPFAEIRPATVSSALWRMANQTGVIEKVREGYGSEPNTYQRVSPDGSTQESLPNEERTSDEADNVSEEVDE